MGRNQQSITEAYQFLVSIMGAVPYGIISIDLEGDIVMINQQAANFLKVEQSLSELTEKSLDDFTQTIPQLHYELHENNTKGRKDFELNNIQSGEQFFIIRGRKILDGMIITIQDITSIKLSEQATLIAMAEGQEKERRRLAKEIHDGCGPLLSTIKLNIEAIESDTCKDHPKNRQRFGKVYEVVDTLADEMRSISHSLLPKVLEDFGLVEALETTFEKIRDTKKIKIAFSHSGLSERLDDTLELAIYRAAQELVNNILKYAHAKKITAQLIQRKDGIMLTVEDDGKGFNKEILNTKESGLGLRNIESRIAPFGGNFDIDTSEGRGTMATIEIPMKN